MIHNNNGDKMKAKKKAKKEDKRFNIIGVITTILFTTLCFFLVKVIVFESDIHMASLKKLTSSIIYGASSPRGRIYDRNYNLLVDNKSVPVIYYKKPNKITSKEEIENAYNILNFIDIDSSKLTLTNFKEFWIADNPSLAKAKITNDEWIKFKNRKLNSKDIYNLQLSRISDDDLSIYNDVDKKAAYIFYLMNKGYSYEEKIIKKEDISDLEYAYIAENCDKLNGFNVKYTWERVYLYGDTFRSILGNISSITKEDRDYYIKKGYSLDDVVGVSYLEKQYEEVLRGKKATYKVHDSNKLSLIEEGKRGNDIVLTIDINLQKEIEEILKEEILRAKNEVNTEYYNHSFVVIQKPNSGEILAMSGKQAVYKNGNYEIYDYTPEMLTSPMTVGSIVKGASMYVGYINNAISIGEYQMDECIKLYSVPKKCSWSRLGYINDITALAQSSNVYQFKIAMKIAGFDYHYNKKFVINNDVFDKYRNTFNEFGLGVKTGIDLPIESVGNIGNSKNADLLLNYAIGQYDTYTTMQLSQYMNTIASDGKRYRPHLLKEVYNSSDDNELGTLDYKVEGEVLNTLTDVSYIKRIQEGLKAVVSYGTGINIMGYIDNPAGKTGTSESFLDTNNDGKVDTATLSKTFAGYAPYDNPVMTLTVTSPDLINPNTNVDYNSYANNRISRRIATRFFESYNN